VAPNVVSSESQLAPFFSAETGQDCYTSEDVRDWTKLGFAVPGDQRLDTKGKEALKKYLRDTYLWYVAVLVQPGVAPSSSLMSTGTPMAPRGRRTSLSPRR
jgi:hypothetical protein